MMAIELEQGGTTSTVITKTNGLQLGHQYRLPHIVERGEYRGKINTYFKEYLYRHHEAYFMTKADGSKPFAVATNDCERDGFEPMHLSKILVDKGHLIVHMYRSPNVKVDPMNVLVMKVIDTHPEDVSGVPAVDVEVIKKFTTYDLVPIEYTEVVMHGLRIIDTSLSAQAMPKYCFNPNRIITVRMFERNEVGDVYSYINNDQKIILNTNSKARIDSEGVTKGGIMRVFYSRKFKESKCIYVEGVYMNPLKYSELKDYVNKSSLDETIAKSLIRLVTTISGNEYYAIVNLSGEVRPLYKSSFGFSSFALNEQEMKMVKDIKEVTEWG